MDERKMVRRKASDGDRGRARHSLLHRLGREHRRKAECRILRQEEGLRDILQDGYAGQGRKDKQDIGCMKEEWAFPGAKLVDPILEGNYHALDFPYTDLDYIFSSHCLEHVDRWVDAMDYWYSKLKIGGVLFLYLPDYSQEYWRPWNNRKHVNIFTPQIIEDYMVDRGYTDIFKSGIDLNNAFMIMGKK